MEKDLEKKVICGITLTLFRMSLFGAAHLTHISCHDQTWYSYTLLKEDS